MLKYFFLIIVCFAFSGFSNGQELPPIQLDRPDQTECPFIVPKGYIQAENGLLFENADQHSQNYVLPTVLWKYGLTKKFEFRTVTEFHTEKTANEQATGLVPVTVGFKINLWQERGWLPLTSFIGHLAVNHAASKPFRDNSMDPSFRFTMLHNLSEKFSLSYNLGIQTIGTKPTGIYTFSLGCTLTEKLAAYAELYGFAAINTLPDHRMDAGFTYLLNNNIMADLSGGLGITPNAPKNYISLGFSYRFRVRNSG